MLWLNLNIAPAAVGSSATETESALKVQLSYI